jgi:hypothetical protein
VTALLALPLTVVEFVNPDRARGCATKVTP